jgi:hypothetical protein
MVQRASEPDPGVDRQARVVALFAVLIDARHKSQFSKAADTQAELEREGVLVRFQPTARQGSPETLIAEIAAALRSGNPNLAREALRKLRLQFGIALQLASDLPSPKEVRE